jgi:hypothetical protein
MSAFLALLLIISLMRLRAFNGRDMIILNVAIPAVQAGFRAHRRGNPVGPAILQGIAGGLLMQKAFEHATYVHEDSTWRAWQSKILLNVGASIAESAGKEMRFRMDLGPVWMLADRKGVRFRLGMHSLVAPMLNFSDGAKLDVGRSLRFGTLSFWRGKKRDGTISSKGALAYSNANNFITDRVGNHISHELIHTYQYRRESFESPTLSRLFNIDSRRFNRWFVDDTGWSLNWAFQTSMSGPWKQNQDFDILMEREAYYLSGKASQKQ